MVEPELSELFLLPEILRASREGDVVEVRRLLPHVRKPADARDWNEKTLLHYSCRHGWLDVTRRLVEQYHCDPESRDEEAWSYADEGSDLHVGDTPRHVDCDKGGDTPLHEACHKGHVNIVKYLVSELGCSVACQNESGNTPLHVAFYKGHVDVVRYLVSTTDRGGTCTLLHEACSKGDLAMVKALTSGQDYKATCSYLNKNRNTPLHFACCEGHTDIVRYLVSECGCSTACENMNGDTPLHLACCYGHTDIARYLVSECGCSTASQNRDGDNPLLVACREGHLSVVAILLTGQDCTTACSKHSDILIHYSCSYGWLDVTRRLVEKYHCDPNGRDLVGNTPLHVACREGHVDIVRYLVNKQGCSTACKNMNGDTPLHLACCNGHVDIVRYLVSEQGCSTACENMNGDAPLHLACRNGHVDIVRYLVSEQGSSIACKNMRGDTPLHLACRNGHAYVVKYLVSEQGSSTACENMNGDIPLHLACCYGHTHVVRYLVSECGCSTACENMNGDTPLHVACRNGHVDIVRYFVSKQGCSATCQNKDGGTLLHKACRKGDLAMVKALTSGQDYKAACKYQNKNGDTPLHFACCYGHTDIARYLVSECGCSTASQNKDGDNPLLVACREGHLSVVAILLTGQDCTTACSKHSDILIHYSCSYGWLDVTRRLVERYHCDPNGRDLVGNTPLHVACCEGHVDIVRYLVSECGCSTACKNMNGDTPLHLACRNGHVDIVRYLVSEQGSSIACKNMCGDTPLHLACRNGHAYVVKYLVSEQGSSTACENMNGDIPLHLACCYGHTDIVRYLVSECGCSTACENMNGDTPLHVACHNGHVDIVRYFVSKQGCSATCQNKDGGTLLHKACRKGDLAMVKALTSGQDYKAACKYQNKNGDTPLHVACHEGHVDIVRYLVSKQGCSATCQNKDGGTLLHEACRKGDLAMVKALTSGQDYKAACSYPNKNGDIPLHVACREGHVDIVRYLVSEQGCSTACRNKDGDTLLHLACREGNLMMVEALASGEDCNCQNKWGDTPLHDACFHGHLEVIRFLTEQNCSAACKFQNNHGKTLLHYSCRHGWLDVTKMLVERYHCDLECRDRWGETPLHEACQKGHLDIVRYLISEQKCSAAYQNKDGDTPLHDACRFTKTGVVQFLLASGRVDPWCKNASSHTPVQLTNNYATSKLFTPFAGLTKAKLQTAIKVFIFGNPGAGKSTLVKVIENKVTNRFSTLAGQFRNVSGVEVNTAGINTVSIEKSRLGSLTIYDLAGQFEYYCSHDALVENLMSSAAVFIAVLKLSENEIEVIRTLQYWISFIENCSSRVEATAHLMVIGSWADKVKETGENIDQKWSRIKKACIFSSSPLHFVGFTALDCRKLASGGLDRICDMIGSSSTALKEAAEQKEIIYPHLLHAVISTKLGSKVACSVQELCTLITTEGDGLLPTEPNLLSPLLSSLSDGGHLLYLPNKKDFEAGWVVIDKQAVLRDINGTIFAPENFKQHHDIATSTGVVPKSKIAGVFAKKYNADMVLCVLTLFEFCQKIEDTFTHSLIASGDPSMDGTTAVSPSDESPESYYFFPALVRVEHPTDVWQGSGPGQYRCGWCLQCAKEGQYLTPRFLHVLLLCLAFSFALIPDSSQQDEASPVLRRRCAIWKNGIQWLDQDGVETIVEVSKQNKLVLLLMSCPEGEELACVQLRSSLISKVLDIKKELCPGISMTELLIDTSNLSSYPLHNSSELTFYRITEQVVNAIREHKQFAIDTTGRKRIKLVKTLHFEPYLELDRKALDHLFCKYCAKDEVSESFLHDLAGNFCPEMKEQVPIATLLKVFKVPPSYIQRVYEQFPEERDNHVMRCFRVLVAWKDNFDTGGSTYQSLRTTLDKYSIFCGRNPLDQVRTCSFVVSR